MLNSIDRVAVLVSPREPFFEWATVELYRHLSWWYVNFHNKQDNQELANKDARKPTR